MVKCPRCNSSSLEKLGDVVRRCLSCELRWNIESSIMIPQIVEEIKLKFEEDKND